ncbi:MULTISPECIES: glycosyltransferase [Spirulina sp. CCY15215]|uniref:glycosyltransferase n=1 Tax=Spirulina sp. CCY15215 TaxID=2767591 RepID=UPI001950E39E|nr:glycosyltransferase [Spirulina major]
MHSWPAARAWSYNVHLGWEAGLKANSVEVLVITTPWLSLAKDIIRGRTFDQVWINDLVLSSGRDGGDVSEAQLEMLATLAPVRVGLLTESIYDYTEAEMAELPDMQRTQAEVEKCLPYLTHVLVFDEADAIAIKQRWRLPCIWTPCSVARRPIYNNIPPPTYNQALFMGSLYHGRQAWLDSPCLQGYLSLKQSPDEETLRTKIFEWLHCPQTRRFKENPWAIWFYPFYLHILRHLRKSHYFNWLQALQSGMAVVNLPHFVKTYTPRVIEGMAAGRPVLSWEIPDRPRNKALFTDGKEILLFNTPEELRDRIQQLRSDALFARKIAENARRCVQQFHTTDKRVQQILLWIETGKEPMYQ